jgi:hypothetical protein
MVIWVDEGEPGHPLETGVKTYVNVWGAFVLLVIGVVKVPELVFEFTVPLAVATTPGGTEVIAQL